MFGIPVTFRAMLDRLKVGNGMFQRDVTADDMNYLTYYKYMSDLMNIYSTCFDWVLPKGCSARQLEYWLMLDGVCAIVRDKRLSELQPDQCPEGFAVMRVTLTGDLDIYDLPEDRRVYSLVQGANDFRVTPENSVIVWDSQMRTPAMPTLDLFARRLSNLSRTIDVNVWGQKTTKIMAVNSKQRQTIINALNQQADNKVQVLGYDDLGIDGLDGLGDFANTAPYVAGDLQMLERNIWNTALSFCGIENQYSDKKERMVSDEVLSNMGDVEMHRFVRSAPRDWATTQAADIWPDVTSTERDDEGNVVPMFSARFRSGRYIRTDKDGLAPTKGMDGTTGYEGGDDGE